MAVSKEDILESISNMSVMDVVELVEAMEEKFGVSAASVAAAPAPAAGGAAPRSLHARRRGSEREGRKHHGFPISEIQRAGSAEPIR